MSNTEKHPLPENLPRCSCFQTEKSFTWTRCADVGGCVATMSNAFHHLMAHEEICSVAMPYVLDNVVVALLAYIAKAQGPALQYGSEDIEREAERLLSGMEARVLARNRESYAAGRALGLTEENVAAMRQSGRETSQ